jgi:hypothetical protein
MMVRPALVLERQKEEAVAEVEEAAAVVTDFLFSSFSIDATPFDVLRVQLQHQPLLVVATTVHYSEQ